MGAAASVTAGAPGALQLAPPAGLERAGQLRRPQALGLLAEMESSRVAWCTIAVNACITACEKDSQWQRALLLLEQMRLRSIERTTITYSACISACEKGISGKCGWAVHSDLARAAGGGAGRAAPAL
jgi:hypothetical protein